MEWIVIVSVENQLLKLCCYNNDIFRSILRTEINRCIWFKPCLSDHCLFWEICIIILTTGSPVNNWSLRTVLSSMDTNMEKDCAILEEFFQQIILDMKVIIYPSQCWFEPVVCILPICTILRPHKVPDCAVLRFCAALEAKIDMG